MSTDHAPPLSRDAVRRIVGALVADELAHQTRRALPAGLVLGWTDATRLDEDGVGVDSLSLLAVAGRVSEFFHMPEVGLEDLLLVRRSLGEWVDLVEATLARGVSALTFRTSGSTGTPKRCDHALADLLREAEALAGLIGPAARVAALVPPHHIFGLLFTVLVPALRGLPVEDLRGVTPGSRLAALRPGDVVVATPHLWSLLADEAGALPAGVAGVTSTAPMPGALAETLARRGVLPLLEVYGSSETGGSGWRTGPGAGFRLFGWWRRADAGVEGPDGAVRPLPDRVEWSGAETLRPIGREDGAVQVAGVNVFPRRVAEVIRRHPRVSDCLVRRRVDDAGARLEAYVVSRGDVEPDTLARDVARLCARELSAPERPAFIDVGGALPLDPLGKPTLW